MHPNDGRVISNFVMQALQNAPITVYGNGMQTRSFCYVDDLIEAILAFMQTEPAHAGPLNLGNPEECTVLDVAQRVIRLTGSKSEIAFVALPQDDPVQRRPDIGKARALLGWEPKTNIDEGLNKTIRYFRSLF
jgi:UDP-glucuronate decarboxylase